MTLIRLNGAVLLLLLMACGGNAATVTLPLDVTPAPVIQVFVPPSLTKVDPKEAAPGEELQIQGSGGRYELRTADGEVTGYIEAPTVFTLFFDDETVGAIGCVANSCWGTLTVPGEATPGLHKISVEGGFSRAFTVVEAQVGTPDATSADGSKGTETPVFFGLDIPSFPSESVIPARYTCDGEDVSPGLSWTAIPPETETFVVIMDDPDAPGGTWDHWVVFNIPGDTLQLQEAQPKADRLPGGGLHGKNSWGRNEYGGPCPPKGPAQTYRFFLYAVDTTLSLPAGASKSKVLDAIEGHVVGESTRTGTFGR